MRKALKKILIFVNLLAISSGLTYYFYRLDFFSIATCIFVAVLAYIILFFYQKNKSQKTPILDSQASQLSNVQKASYIFSLVLIVILFYLLAANSTVEPIISPWQVVPDYFLALFIVSTFSLLIAKPKSFILYIPHAALFFSLAAIIYRIGYGYDPFIHQATVDLIVQKGAVTPKVPYYLGQYGLETVIHLISGISIRMIDTWLMPILSSLAIPLVLSSYFNDKKSSLALLFLVPLPFFIVTTPQNLAYLWLMISIFSGLSLASPIDKYISITSALAALITQPIAGIPAVCWALYITAKERAPRLFRRLLIVAPAVVLPALLFMSTGSLKTLDFSSIFSLPATLAKWFFLWPASLNFIQNAAYLLSRLFPVIIVSSIAFAFKQKDKRLVRPLYFASACIIGFIFAGLVPADKLIDYERSDYSQRLLYVAYIFCLPAVYSLFSTLYRKADAGTALVRYSWYAFFAMSIGTSLYFSYPRMDDFFNSRGYSVGRADLETIEKIRATAGTSYIVLANQQVSVAALRLHGFDHYLKNDIFYYPIPTGGQLYQYFLEMIYVSPKKETMEKAMDLAGVNESFFVVNKYWWASSKTIDEAKLSCTSWESIDNGNVYIFKYSR